MEKEVKTGPMGGEVRENKLQERRSARAPCRAFCGRGLGGPREGYSGVLWSSPFPSCSTGLEHTASQVHAGGVPGAGDLLIPSLALAGPDCHASSGAQLRGTADSSGWPQG